MKLLVHCNHIDAPHITPIASLYNAAMHAIILSIGDELVLGQTVDTNSAYLSAQLASRGIMTRFHQTIADDQDAIAQAFTWASNEADLVIVTGGLGPTEDDLTRQALAQAMGVELVVDEESLAAITGYFAKRNRIMPDRNRIQAMQPRGCKAIPNSCGTAPGMQVQFSRAMIFVTPGVPSELFAMFRLSVVPYLDELAAAQPALRRTILTQKINTFGLGESDVAEKLGELMDRKRNPLVGTTVSDGLVSVRIRSEFDDPQKAQAELDYTITQAERLLGPVVIGRESQTMQAALVELLLAKKATLATAESCTGGLVAKSITDVAGSSAVFAGGWVTYANEMKAAQLNVPMSLIEKHGAVSEPVARSMAQGAIEKSGATLSVAITGIAGPGGGTEAKPVGTIWIAIGSRDQATGTIATDARLYYLPGDREQIRDRAAKCAMQMLRFHIMGIPLDELRWGRKQK